MSLKQQVVEWGMLIALKDMCESQLKPLSDYDRKIVEAANRIYNEQVAQNLAACGHPPRKPCDVIDPNDCCHIGDIIWHLRCQGMKTSAACAILTKASQEVENNHGQKESQT